MDEIEIWEYIRKVESDLREFAPRMTLDDKDFVKKYGEMLRTNLDVDACRICCELLYEMVYLCMHAR